ncbi:hypothetical protein GCM10029964_016040 [Kibdelosporangium lantanae]
MQGLGYALTMKDQVDGIVEAWRRELPEVAGIELELGKRIHRLSALMTEAVTRQLVEFKLTKAEYDVLAVLRSQGAPFRLRPTDLVSRLLLSSGGRATSCAGSPKPASSPAKPTQATPAAPGCGSPTKAYGPSRPRSRPARRANASCSARCRPSP